jgi:hypothetical protein
MLCRNSKDLESEFGRRLAICGNDEVRSITGHIVPTSALQVQLYLRRGIQRHVHATWLLRPEVVMERASKRQHRTSILNPA